MLNAKARCQIVTIHCHHFKSYDCTNNTLHFCILFSVNALLHSKNLERFGTHLFFLLTFASAHICIHTGTQMYSRSSFVAKLEREGDGTLEYRDTQVQLV